jgi:hypothetical protein
VRDRRATLTHNLHSPARAAHPFVAGSTPPSCSRPGRPGVLPCNWTRGNRLPCDCPAARRRARRVARTGARALRSAAWPALRSCACSARSCLSRCDSPRRRASRYGAFGLSPLRHLRRCDWSGAGRPFRRGHCGTHMDALGSRRRARLVTSTEPSSAPGRASGRRLLGVARRAMRPAPAVRRPAG